MEITFHHRSQTGTDVHSFVQSALQPSVGHLENPAVMLAERSRMARRYAAEMRNANEREWTMDEINAEIKAARRERKARING